MIILLLFSLLAPQAQIDRQKLKQQAQQLCDESVNGNYDRAADLTYPKLIRLMGGPIAITGNQAARFVP